MSYKRESLGLVEKDDGAVTELVAETHVVFGQILDPSINWVELTLDLEGAESVQATVVDGHWLVKLAPEDQQTGFELRAGNEKEVRFVASVGKGRNYRRKSLDPEPLVEYLDKQQGIRLQYPLTSDPRVEGGRLLISLGGGAQVYVEQEPDLRGFDVTELLQRELAEGGDRVVESGIRTLGSHEAAYILEATPNSEGEGTGYTIRYLTSTDDTGYEVLCTAKELPAEVSWELGIKPLCQRVLETVRLGSDVTVE